MKYIKKPIVVEAIQWNGHNLSDIEKFASKNLVYDIEFGVGTAYTSEHTVVNVQTLTPPKVNYIAIKTLEGNMKANIGDYIVKDINGEFYPVKEDIFLKIYEPLKSESIK